MFALITPRASLTRSKNVEYFNLSYVPVRRSICTLLIGTTPITLVCALWQATLGEPSDTIAP
jgi:hypothetical protein